MSYKLGLILSLIFVAGFFLFGVDLITLQFTYSDLDAKAVTIGYLIAKHGTIDTNLEENIERDYNVSFTCLSNCTPKFGEIVSYKISRPYDSLIIFQGTKNIEVIRTTVIGYYD